MRHKQTRMQNIILNFSTHSRFCAVLALVIGMLTVSTAAAQMLQPDRGGWGDSRSVDTQINDWPYEQPSQSIPVDRIPDAQIRDEIGLASFEQEAKTEPEPRLPAAAPQRTAALPPRDAMTDPFFKATSAPVFESRTDESLADKLAPPADNATDSSVVHSGYFAVQPNSESEANDPAESPQSQPFDLSSFDNVFSGGNSAMSRTGLGSSVKAMLLLATLSLAPAIVLMTTSYVRVVVVLSLLRQAFGSQQLPPTQVITALSLFLTMLVMAPVWNEVKTEAIDPYAAEGSQVSWQSAWDAGVKPVRSFMQKQIQLAGNEQSIATFYRYLPETSQQPPESFDDVPLNVLLPAFMVSELKVAFLLGFQVFLPFLVLDLVVSSVTVSMGMLMLPPNMVSFPLKLILFVMVDGWNLVIGMLLQSFGPFV